MDPLRQSSPRITPIVNPETGTLVHRTIFRNEYISPLRVAVSIYLDNFKNPTISKVLIT